LTGTDRLGFVGWCIIRSDKKEVAEKIGHLFSLASYINIGYGKSIGLGVIELSATGDRCS
ncbi:MAG: CRISPR system precrRNA processing endoribonuclease RAMP protein Cas6, partial [Candidatus Njordarchaeota archaeon]